MKITATVTVEVPDWLDEGKCVYKKAPIGTKYACPFLNIDRGAYQCALFSSPITWEGIKCQPCLDAIKESTHDLPMR